MPPYPSFEELHALSLSRDVLEAYRVMSAKYKLERKNPFKTPAEWEFIIVASMHVIAVQPRRLLFLRRLWALDHPCSHACRTMHPWWEDPLYRHDGNACLVVVLIACERLNVSYDNSPSVAYANDMNQLLEWAEEVDRGAS